MKFLIWYYLFDILYCYACLFSIESLIISILLTTFSSLDWHDLSFFLALHFPYLLSQYQTEYHLTFVEQSTKMSRSIPQLLKFWIFWVMEKSNHFDQ